EFVNDTQAYEDALQAYQEYQPIREQFYDTPDDARTDSERQLYRSQSFGSDAALFVTDSRSFRDAQLAPANIADPTEFLVQAFDPSRTLLGRAQLDLLKADLLAAEANGTTWKFVVIPEPIQNFGVANAEDRFEGYAAERTELLSFIDQNEIDNVVFMAGDFHGTIVNNLTYQVGPGQAQIATSAFEIVTGPVAFFDGRFGPNVVGLASAFGLITPEQQALYDALPVAPDLDDIPNDKDDFVEQLLIAQTDVLGYDPVGLDNNLAIADGLVNATLLQGDYVSAHTYSWTELNIAADTQQLTVTTYGIDAYSEAELLADPQAVLNLTPRIVSQFKVAPELTVTTPTSLDFEGPGLTAGTVVSDQFSGLTITTDGLAAMLFDSANPTGGDDDLSSDTAGLVLILSEDGDRSNPDDNAGGGTLEFTWDELVDIASVGFLDTEEAGSIDLYGADSAFLGSLDIVMTNDGEAGLVEIDQTDISKMVVNLGGSGAITAVNWV
ncbi:MAG: alkaline phosphatase D family protein, partial [Cyanobacteria bacterium P01_A01_bin.70]